MNEEKIAADKEPWEAAERQLIAEYDRLAESSWAFGVLTWLWGGGAGAMTAAMFAATGSEVVASPFALIGYMVFCALAVAGIVNGVRSLTVSARGRKGLAIAGITMSLLPLALVSVLIWGWLIDRVFDGL